MTEAERSELIWRLKREQIRRNLIAMIRDSRARALQGLTDLSEDTRAYKRHKKEIGIMDAMLRRIGA